MVDFPEPLGPIIEIIFPCVKSAEKLFTTSFLSYLNEMSFAETAVITKVPPYFLLPELLSRYRKNGAPNIDITIPTGNSIGEAIVRAKVSAPSSKTAPLNIENGNRLL